MGCPELTERDYYRLQNCTEKTAYSRFFFTVTDDQIGNRKTYDTTESGSNVQSVYSANSLNQYTSIGSMGSTWSPTHDDDGNMLTMALASGEWSATYNGENRLASIENSSKRLEFSYDYMGRRVEKKVYSGTPGSWTLDEHSRFVYDGYLQIEKLDVLNSNAVIRKRIWSDGKVVCDIHGSTAYYALGDANKNITEYIDSTGAVAAHFEYSPFGKITVASGTDPDDFDFRFSSEVFEHETGLVYYNYRYYSPELGRWLTRDPIGEEGHILLKRMSKKQSLMDIMNELINAYKFVDNNPINKFDILGEAIDPASAATAAIAAAYLICMSSFYLYANSNYTDDKGYNDKFRHCYVTCKSTFYCGGPPGTAFMVGVLYEVCGQTGEYTEWTVLKKLCPAFGDLKDSLGDIVANAVGTVCAMNLVCPCDICCRCVN